MHRTLDAAIALALPRKDFWVVMDAILYMPASASQNRNRAQPLIRSVACKSHMFYEAPRSTDHEKDRSYVSFPCLKKLCSGPGDLPLDTGTDN